MNTSNTESGSKYDDGYRVTTGLVSAKNVAWTRQARAYRQLRDKIDAHHMNTHPQATDRQQLELPHRLCDWRTSTSLLVRQAHPDLDGAVTLIEQLIAERATMRADPTFIPVSKDKRVPLPIDPAKRKAERNRRDVASMRRLRERRRAERTTQYKCTPLPTDLTEREAEKRRRQSTCMRRLRERYRLESDPANANNLDLVGLPNRSTHHEEQIK